MAEGEVIMLLARLIDILVDEKRSECRQLCRVLRDVEKADKGRHDHIIIALYAIASTLGCKC